MGLIFLQFHPWARLSPFLPQSRCATQGRPPLSSLSPEINCKENVADYLDRSISLREFMPLIEKDDSTRRFDPKFGRLLKSEYSTRPKQFELSGFWGPVRLARVFPCTTLGGCARGVVESMGTVHGSACGSATQCLAQTSFDDASLRQVFSVRVEYIVTCITAPSSANDLQIPFIVHGL